MKVLDIVIQLNYYFNIPAKIVYKKYQRMISQDIVKYVTQIPEYLSEKQEKIFFAVLLKRPAFRSVLMNRIKRHEDVGICEIVFLKCFKPLPTIEVSGEIGEGLFIAHNYCVLVPQKAGKNLSVMGGVTIGEKNGKTPIIGDNVYIGANASIIGGISIGNNVKIGAGAVVISDIPDNAVAVGNPARIILK